MGIEFLKNENIFHLSGGDVSYILKIYKNAFPMHLYWGKRLSDPAISWYLEAPYRRKNCLREQNRMIRCSCMSSGHMNIRNMECLIIVQQL
ncbi:MAG: hypothetical protein SOZ33_05710 [Negativibacillus massiliensis]|nr:hypothetical protein [Negativibacillus massiliensis]